MPKLKIHNQSCRLCRLPATGVVVGKYAQTPVCDKHGAEQQDKGKLVQYAARQRTLAGLSEGKQK